MPLLTHPLVHTPLTVKYALRSFSWGGLLSICLYEKFLKNVDILKTSEAYLVRYCSFFSSYCNSTMNDPDPPSPQTGVIPPPPVQEGETPPSSTPCTLLTSNPGCGTIQRGQGHFCTQHNAHSLVYALVWCVVRACVMCVCVCVHACGFACVCSQKHTHAKCIHHTHCKLKHNTTRKNTPPKVSPRTNTRQGQHNPKAIDSNKEGPWVLHREPARTWTWASFRWAATSVSRTNDPSQGAALCGVPPNPSPPPPAVSAHPTVKP